jgi:hypothetical protein
MSTFYTGVDKARYDAGEKFLPQNRFLKSYTAPTTNVEEETEVTTSYGIPNTNAFTNSGGGSFYAGNTSDLIGNYQKTIDDRQARLNNPSNTFLGLNTMRDQQLTGPDLGAYIGSNTAIPQEKTMMGKVQSFLTPQSAKGILEDGYQEPRFQPGIIGTLMGKLDNYRNLSKVDQAFIAQNMGYTGPTVFGDNNSGLSKDLYGINTRSMFGNYADYVDNAAQLDMTDEEYAALSKFQKQKVDFYRAQVEEKKLIEQQEIEKEKKQAQDFMDKNPGYGDPEVNKNPGSGGGHGYDEHHDYSGTSTKDKHDRSSDLGFSDIRLKEKVELIGKSPSNINIYKFNYKDSPTIYQGAMAHEVPWASIKHSNGYMMVDYNKIDVNFKKI